MSIPVTYEPNRACLCPDAQIKLHRIVGGWQFVGAESDRTDGYLRVRLDFKRYEICGICNGVQSVEHKIMFVSPYDAINIPIKADTDK